MVTFIRKSNISCEFDAKIDGVTRFIVAERGDFAGGWNLLTLDLLLIDRFNTLCAIEEYIEELDK